MDWNAVGGKLTEWVKKYRYVILVLAIGMGLMLIPEGKPQEEQNPEPVQQTQPDLEQELCRILSRIKGAGDVEVLLTQSAGERTLYQTDEDTSDSAHRVETVIVTDADRNQRGLVLQTLSPQYQGAIIVCEGAENAAVRLAVVEAVADVTGLGADRISVLKMK